MKPSSLLSPGTVYVFWFRHIPVMALAALPFGVGFVLLHYVVPAKNIFVLGVCFIFLLFAQAFFDSSVQNRALKRQVSWKARIKDTRRLGLAYILLSMMTGVFVVVASLILSAVLASILQALNPSIPTLSTFSDFKALGASVYIGLQAVSWVLGLGIAFLFLRFSLTAPLTVKTGHIRVFTSWKKTRGHTLPLIVSALLVFGPFIVLACVILGSMNLSSHEGSFLLKTFITHPSPWLRGFYAWLFIFFGGGIFQSFAALWSQRPEVQGHEEEIKS